eukprot:TRINITY_DN10083_c0_g1_i3.p1 TRINITY_DN10083_c0_g1~~TRINITY_DN10083_c0_g1_i3.p1  ORF type:complete len:214 (-),score=30.81 TRINITY_DN10083_c0_g1_i3:143-751(-)
MATHAAVSWNAAVPAGCASGAAALALPRWAPHWRDRDELVPPHPLDVLGATGRPSGSSAVAASTGFIYVQAIRASGEEIAWLRVRPAHHIGALRERLARLLFGEGSSCLRLAAHGRMLEDQDIVAGAGICSGSVSFRRERPSWVGLACAAAGCGGLRRATAGSWLRSSSAYALSRLWCSRSSAVLPRRRPVRSPRIPRSCTR